MKFSDYKKETLKDKEVRREYDALGKEVHITFKDKQHVEA